MERTRIYLTLCDRSLTGALTQAVTIKTMAEMLKRSLAQTVNL